MFGEEVEKTVPGTPRVILALANHAHSAGWDRAKVLQRAMFKAAAGSGLEMKFAFYGADNAADKLRPGSTRNQPTSSGRISAWPVAGEAPRAPSRSR
jgi:hypothetical protein